MSLGDKRRGNYDGTYNVKGLDLKKEFWVYLRNYEIEVLENEEVNFIEREEVYFGNCEINYEEKK